MKDIRIEKDGKAYILAARMTENRFFWLFTIYEVDPTINRIIYMLGKRTAMTPEEALLDVLKSQRPEEGV